MLLNDNLCAQVVIAGDKRLLRGSWIPVRPLLDPADARQRGHKKHARIWQWTRCEIRGSHKFSTRRFLERLYCGRCLVNYELRVSFKKKSWKIIEILIFYEKKKKGMSMLVRWCPSFSLSSMENSHLSPKELDYMEKIKK